jgi:hypothetical protein
VKLVQLRRSERHERAAERARAPLAHRRPRIGQRSEHQLLERRIVRGRELSRALVLQPLEEAAEGLLAHHRPAHRRRARTRKEHSVIAAEQHGELLQASRRRYVEAIDRRAIQNAAVESTSCKGGPAKVEAQQTYHGGRQRLAQGREEDVQARAQRVVAQGLAH